jgi:hypothetical protein
LPCGTVLKLFVMLPEVQHGIVVTRPWCAGAEAMTWGWQFAVSTPRRPPGFKTSSWPSSLLAGDARPIVAGPT